MGLNKESGGILFLPFFIIYSHNINILTFILAKKVIDIAAHILYNKIIKRKGVVNNEKNSSNGVQI